MVELEADNKVRIHVQKIRFAVNEDEMYHPVRTLLTLISRTIFGELTLRLFAHR